MLCWVERLLLSCSRHPFSETFCCFRTTRWRAQNRDPVIRNSEVLSPLSQNLVRVLVHGSMRIPSALSIYLQDDQLNAMTSRLKLAPFFLPSFDHNLFYLSSNTPVFSLDFQGNSPSSLHLYTRHLLSYPEQFSFQPLICFFGSSSIPYSFDRGAGPNSSESHPTIFLPQKNLLTLSPQIFVVTM